MYAHPDDVARISEAAYRFATEGGTYEVIYRTKTKHCDDYRIIHAMGKHVYTDEGVRLARIWYLDEGARTGTRARTAWSAAPTSSCTRTSGLVKVAKGRSQGMAGVS